MGEGRCCDFLVFFLGEGSRWGFSGCASAGFWLGGGRVAVPAFFCLFSGTSWIVVVSGSC